MILSKDGEGHKANGRKYYIGNGNKAAFTSTFGKFEDQGDTKGEYVFFAAKSDHPNYKLIKNVAASQNYVSEYELNDYPVSDSNILHTGDDAWNAALNTVNIGKYNLAWASIGICTHALYEAINHAANRRLYNMYVTDFSHVQKLFVEAYCRLNAMKLFTARAADYMRHANADDRRYLLYNPMAKMKTTTEGEHVINALWDVIAAKGFEKDTYFGQAAIDIRALPKLEGTVHVNIALIVKFMPNFFFNPAEYPEVGTMDQPTNDDFLFKQGSTHGLSKIRFHDYQQVFAKFNSPNIKVFKSQVEEFRTMLATAPPNKEQSKDIDFLLTGGELFALVVYAQLILENAPIYEVSEDLLEQIFDCLIKDFSKFALALYHKHNATEAQQAACLKMIKKPVFDEARYQKIWQEVHGLKGVYEMPKADTRNKCLE